MTTSKKGYLPLENTGKPAVLAAPVEKLPIIVVPGIMGTRLQSALADMDGYHRLVWDPPGGLGEAGSFKWTADVPRLTWGAEKLEPATEAQTWALPSEYKDIRNPGHLVWSFYGALAMALRDRLAKRIEAARKAASPPIEGAVEPVVYCCGYDWRYENERSARDYLGAVVDQVRREVGDVRVVLLAHSMGGLVSRCYSLLNPHKVSALFLMGSPTLGAPGAYTNLKNGLDPMGSPGIILDFGKGDKRANSRRFMRQFPAAYQLLPHYLYSSHVDRDWAELNEEDTGIDRYTWPVPEERGGKFKKFADGKRFQRPFLDLYTGIMDGKEGEHPTKFDTVHIQENINHYVSLTRKLTRDADWFRAATVFMPARTYTIFSEKGKTVTGAELKKAKREHKGKAPDQWVVATADAKERKTKNGGDQTVPTPSAHPGDHATFEGHCALTKDVGHADMATNEELIKYVLDTLATLCCAAAGSRLPEPYGSPPASPAPPPTPASSEDEELVT